MSKPVTKLISWNVNGIRAALRKGFMEFIAQHNPDILCLQETKAHRDQAQVDLPQYQEYWNSAEKKGYSGTAIFSKCTPLSVTVGLLESVTNGKQHQLIDAAGRDGATEGRVITAEYPNYYLVNVYTPNAKDDLSRLEYRHKAWDPLFLQHLVQLDKTKPVVVCGDLNVAHTELDLARPKENVGKKGFTNEEREGLDQIIEHGFTDSFRMFNKAGGNYTWWSHWANARQRNIGWRIDYFLVSNRLEASVKSAAILPEVLGSDHCPVVLELSV